MPYTDIIVAVHGIGDQRRGDTVRSVATRFARSPAFPTPAAACPPLSPQPLGYFHGPMGSVAPLDASLLGDAGKVGLSEVFWANVPQEVVDEGRTLEETKAWARTVVARSRALCASAPPKDGREIIPPDFSLAGEVLDEVIETVHVLENLTVIAEKAGLFQFDLRKLLDQYLGDVQIVTEFSLFRNNIVGRFHRAMQLIYESNKEADIYIVAHSEGTVVTFLAVLMAMSGTIAEPMTNEQLEQAMAGVLEMPAGSDQPNVKKNQPLPAWLGKVRGFMTIGSPIDKHLLLWPALCRDLDPAKANALFAGRPIRWRNYYDYGDPVGFKLETARDWLQTKKCTAFQFCGCEKCGHDLGFARYLLPGKAHNDYWDDPLVFEHFIRTVVRANKPDEQGADRTEPPKPVSKTSVAIFSPSLPYVLSFAILFAGVWILYRAVIDYTNVQAEPFQQYVRYTLLGLEPEPAGSSRQLALNTLGIAALVSGVTLLARLPRLAFGLRWWCYGAAAFAAGAAAYCLVPETSRKAIGSVFGKGPVSPTAGLIIVAFLVAVVGLLSALKNKKKQSELLKFNPTATPRRQRWFRKGMRPLILCGAVGLAIIVGSRINVADQQRETIAAEVIKLRENERLGESKPALTDKEKVEIRKLAVAVSYEPPLWPVLLSGAAFLYLWWLAALIFDLAFVWQRYIRQSVALNRLRQWSPFPSTGGEEPHRDLTQQRP